MRPVVLKHRSFDALEAGIAKTNRASLLRCGKAWLLVPHHLRISEVFTSELLTSFPLYNSISVMI